MQPDIPQVACCLTPRSRKSSLWTSAFCPERRLRSRGLLKRGGSDHEATVFLPGGGVFQRGGQTCPADFVQFESEACSRA